jgi:hypothetical protein
MRNAGVTTGPVRTLHDVIPRTEAMLEDLAGSDLGRDETDAAHWGPGVELERLHVARAEAISGLGARVGVEWVDTRLVGKSLLSCIYLEKFATGLLVWRFVWYSNGERWVVLRLDISQDPSALVHLLPNPAGS